MSHRLQMDATSEEVKTLDAMKAPGGVRTRKGVLLQALRLLKTLRQRQEEGWTVRAVKEGKPPVEPVL